MTEEEQKVIENIENSIECLFFPSYFGEGSFIMNIELNDLKIILNLINKQQKELDKKDKVIDKLYEEIELEYSGTYMLKSLEEYYEEVEKVGGEDE